MDERVLDLLKLTDYVMRVYVPSSSEASRCRGIRVADAAGRGAGLAVRRVLREPADGRDLPLAEELPAGRGLGVQVERSGHGRDSRPAL